MLKVVDVQDVKKCLIKPNIYVVFSALYPTIDEGGQAYKQWRQYAMNADTGDVYYRHQLNNLSESEAHFVNPQLDSEIYAAWSIIKKHNVIAMVRWAIKTFYYTNAYETIEICDTPSVGCFVDSPDKNALFRWVVPEDNIFPDEIVVIDKDKNIQHDKSGVKHPYSCLFNDNPITLSSQGLKATRNLKVFSDFFGYSFIGNNRYSDLKTTTDIAAFLRIKNPTPDKSKKQKQVDELSQIHLNKPQIPKNAKSFCYISRVSSEWAVVRWFNKTGKKFLEVYRLYVSKKEQIYCRVNISGQFISFNGRLSPHTFSADRTVMETLDVFQGTKLEFFSTIYDSISEEKLKPKALFMLLNYPEFEILWKANMSEFCIKYLSKYDDLQWKSYVELQFGKINTKAKNIYSMLGMNKHQLNKFQEKIAADNRNSNLIVELKKAFHTEDLRNVDNKSFDTIFDFVVKLRPTDCNNVVHILGIIVEDYSLKTAVNLVPYIKNLLSEKENALIRDRFDPISQYNTRTFDIYKDIILMIHYIENANKIKPCFKDMDELIKAHEMLVDIFYMERGKKNSCSDEHSLKKFEARKSVWKKLEYNKNEKFIVIAPSTAVDIANEGLELHHCVKSYIHDVVEGKTNILFIRKKDAPDTPFFTVEVSNDSKIRQIHGAFNCNVDSEPGLDDFIKEWTNAVGIQINSYDKCLCA